MIEMRANKNIKPLPTMEKELDNNMKITDLINGKVEHDKFGGKYFWIKGPEGGLQMLAEMRGWGHIQNMFPKTEEGHKAAGEYQDKVGDFIAEAINEKIERMREVGKTGSEQVCGHPKNKCWQVDNKQFCEKCNKWLEY